MLCVRASFSLGFFESHCQLMVTYVGPTVLKRKLFSKLQQFWAEKQLSIFFYKKGEFVMFLCEPLETPK